MNNEAKNPLQKMIDDTVALLNKRKLTDAILSAQTVSDLAEAEHDYYIYATAQNLMGVSYVAAGNEMSAVDCYLRGRQQGRSAISRLVSCKQPESDDLKQPPDEF